MVALHMLRSSGVKSSRPAVVRGWVTALLKASGPAELHMLHRRGVKSSRPALGVGWVTTGISRLASVWRGLGGVSRRIGRFGACWRGTRRVGSRLLMAEAWSPV
jgi:hypothetical protein